MSKRLWVSATALLGVVCLVAAGCAPDTQTTTPPSPTSPTTTSPPTTPTTPSQPSDKVFKLRMQTTHGTAELKYKVYEEWANNLRTITGGRLDITVYPSGAIVKVFEQLDALRDGVIDLDAAYGAYWRGIDPAFGMFCNIPMGLGGDDYMTWYYEAGGLELARELYAQHNCHIMGFIGAGAEFSYSKVPVRTLSDFSGLKGRYSNLGADVYSELGVSVVNLAGSEVYTALQTGVIDITDYGDPAINYAIGLHEVTDYIIAPAIHEPVSMNEFKANMDVWNKLPDDLKTTLEYTIMAAGQRAQTKTDYEAGLALLAMQDSGM